MNEERECQYIQMKGEYIGLMASLEYSLTSLIIEYLGVKNHREEFSKWFVEAPIPFNYKVNLLKRTECDNPLLETNLPNFWKDFSELQGFRNIVAHSFGSIGRMTTARGKIIPEEQVTFEALSGKLEKLRILENQVLNLLVTEYEGIISPISADDFVDGPT